MSDTFITIFIILTAAVLILMVPVVVMAKRNDITANQAVQAAVTEFVDKARTTGVVRREDYDILIQELEATRKCV